MSRERSPATGKPYGAARVCAAFELPRSSYYARREAQKAAGNRADETAAPKPAPHKRGPKTPLTDDTLLDLIRADLAASPFRGEGHRKVWARLRLAQGVRVSPKRVLRLMRENKLLSPRRVPQGVTNLHNGDISTDGPQPHAGH